MKFFRILRVVLSPTRAIAQELKVLRELYEMDLASRGLYRSTQTADKGDTEISYSDVVEPRSKVGKWLRRGEEDDLAGDA